MDPDPLLAQLSRVLRSVSDEDTLALVRSLCEAQAVHLAGSGRSNLIVQSFAVRLAQLGCRVHVLGEATAPACRQGDLLVVCSGSGNSPTMLIAAEHALRAGARLAVVTAAALAPLTRLASVKVLLPPVLPSAPPEAAGQTRHPPDETELVAALRTTFEQAAFLYLDVVAQMLKDYTGQSDRQLEQRLANLD